MAVDANILVCERIKVEIRKGGLLDEAIEVGFNRAWTSIRDSNVATLVICFILWTFGRNFGASVVQGFALTLAIGVMISMFTAVTVTRTFVRLAIGRARGDGHEIVPCVRRQRIAFEPDHVVWPRPECNRDVRDPADVAALDPRRHDGFVVAAPPQIPFEP